MTELLKPDPEVVGRVWFNAAREERLLTLAASRWSLKWKSWEGVLLRESASMWWTLTEMVSGSGSESEPKVVDSGQESVGGLGRLRRMRVWDLSGSV